MEKYLYYVLIEFVFIELLKIHLSQCLLFFIIVTKYRYLGGP